MIDLEYLPVHDVMVYAKYARGYRQGSVATFVQDGFHLYKPEYVDSYELGEKTSFHGAVDGTFNVTGFYNDFTDQQLLIGLTEPGQTPSSGIINAGKSRIYGAEVEATLVPIEPLTFGVSYTYLNTRLLSLAQPAAPPNTVLTYVSLPGDPLPFSPKNKFSVNGSYRLPVPDNLGQVSLGAIFTYTSTQVVSSTSPGSFISPYGLLDLNLNWNSIAGSSVDASLFANNALDRLYLNNVTQTYDTVLGWQSRFYGEPTLYGVRVRIRFGKT
jgi:iron complex outermembrane receptor protein